MYVCTKLHVNYIKSETFNKPDYYSERFERDLKIPNDRA